MKAENRASEKLLRDVMIEDMTQVDFYAALDAETRIVVQQRTTEIKVLMKRAASDIIEAGAKCADVQSLLRHNKSGGFDGWIKHEGLEPRTVYRLLDVWRAFGNLDKLSRLEIGISALYLLSAPNAPESARQEALDRAAAGESITHQLARDIVSNHHNPPLPFVPEEEEHEIIAEGISGLSAGIHVQVSSNHS